MSQIDARNRLGIEQHRPVILFLGQIKKEKGLEYLIQALPTVLERVPNALLLIAGRPWHTEVGTYEAQIHALGLHDHVRTCCHS